LICLLTIFIELLFPRALTLVEKAWKMH